MLAAGTRLGRYTLGVLLGSGSMAEVYAATDDVSGAAVAIKVLRARGATLAARIRAEGRLQATLRHPNLVQAYGLIEAFGAPAIVSERVYGPDLQRVLQRGPLQPGQVDALARGILAGVAAAHAAGVIHRDLKPSNVLLAPTPDGPVPKVSDFGLVKALGDDVLSLTRTGTALGTPGFMAPEQLRDAKRADAAADVFALGALIYAMATGVPPFRGRDLAALLLAAEAEDYAPLAERVPELGPARLAAVATALRGAKEGRFPDAAAFLDTWASAEPLTTDWSDFTELVGEARVVPDHGADTLPSVDDATWVTDVGDPGAREAGGAVDVPFDAPALGDPFFGRSAALADATARLAAHPVVCVLGGPGIGKTRFAHALATAVRADFPGGVCWRAAGDPIPPPVRDGRRLVVVDGFDDLAGGGEASLALGPDAAVLVTSRVRPLLDDAGVVRLGPLELPDAVALFVARARVVKPGFALSESNRADVEALVEGLGRNPLAIELAASRTAVIPPAKLVARLSDRLRLLTGRDGRSMGDEIAASWGRLAEDDRRHLRDLIERGDTRGVRSLLDHGLVFEGEHGPSVDPTVVAWVRAYGSD